MGRERQGLISGTIAGLCALLILAAHYFFTAESWLFPTLAVFLSLPLFSLASRAVRPWRGFCWLVPLAVCLVGSALLLSSDVSPGWKLAGALIGLGLMPLLISSIGYLLTIQDELPSRAGLERLRSLRRASIEKDPRP